LLQAIIKELEIQKQYLHGAEIQTIYFGGGTPSLLSADEINKIFDFISGNYTISNLQEFTLEANPDDLDIKYLKTLKSTPVNRLSIGIQSFKESDLQYMHRAHNAQEADYAIKAAQDSGFTNLTIDLIYGTPGLEDADWKKNLSKIQELQIPHFSAYALTVEEGTALHHSIKKKASKPVDAEQQAAQFEILTDAATIMDYEQYEISNFAKPGMYAIHNTNYWKGVPYIGIGPSAHSFDGKNRRWNIANNALYIKALLTDNILNFEEEQLSTTQHVNEYIMTSLRTMWGCDLNKINNTWGADFAKNIKENSNKYIHQNKIKMEGDILILTNPGKLFADNIACELFVE